MGKDRFNKSGFTRNRPAKGRPHTRYELTEFFENDLKKIIYFLLTTNELVFIAPADIANYINDHYKGIKVNIGPTNVGRYFQTHVPTGRLFKTKQMKTDDGQFITFIVNRNVDPFSHKEFFKKYRRYPDEILAKDQGQRTIELPIKNPNN